MKNIVVLVTCFFLTLSFATDSYAAKGFKFKCTFCKEISEFVKTKLTDGMDFVQTKLSNTLHWIDEKLGWGFLSKGGGRVLGKVCKEYELCCTEPLDSFCKDLKEESSPLEICKKIAAHIDLKKLDDCEEKISIDSKFAEDAEIDLKSLEQLEIQPGNSNLKKTRVLLKRFSEWEECNKSDRLIKFEQKARSREDPFSDLAVCSSGIPLLIPGTEDVFNKLSEADKFICIKRKYDQCTYPFI